MLPAQFEAVLDEYAALDLEAATLEEVWGRLVLSIQKHTGARRVSLSGAWIERSNAGPARELPLQVADTLAETAERPALLGDLVVLGERPVLADLRELAPRLVEEVGAEPQRALALRVRLPHYIAWWVVRPASPIEEGEPLKRWTSALLRLTRLVTQAQDEIGSLVARSPRAEFARELLDLEPQAPKSDLQRICAIWSRAAGADWVWLWMYNAYTDEYELTSFAPAGDPPRERLVPKGDGIGQFCSRRRVARFVADIRTWRESVNGVEHSVMLREHLLARGCVSMLCVPLFERESPAPGEQEHVNVLTAHFKPASQPVRFLDEALLEMGRLTAQNIAAVQRAEQARIQDELNQLAQRHLARIERLQSEVLEEYLDELLRLLQQRLNTSGVSIFLRTRLGDAVRCYASTGLQKGDGTPVPANEYPATLYAAGEGYTGAVYSTGQWKLSVAPDSEPGHAPKYREVRKHPAASGVDPIVLCPIPGSPRQNGDAARALGVIRCVGHEAPLFKEHDSPFTPFECESLGFIAQQVSPILQTLMVGVERETTIAVLRHDLVAPLVMVRDTMHRVLHPEESDKPPGEHDFKDIELCNALTMRLVDQLSPDAAEFQALQVEPTNLEGDIIARLKNMLSHYAFVTRRMQIHFGNNFRSIPPLLLDRKLIERVFQNLVVNAVKYGREQTTIEIDARPTTSNPQFYIVDIANYGIGIEEDEKGKIFLAHYRTQRAKKASVTGAGLGLSISRQAMVAHGGDLNLTALKEPTIFSVYFPKSRLSLSPAKGKG